MAAGKKRGGLTIILLALVVIVVLVVVYFLVIQGGGKTRAPEQTPTPEYELLNIVITSQNIPRGTVITESVLTTIRYPKNEMPEGTFFTDIIQVVGTRAKYDLGAAVPLTPSMLLDKESGSVASFDIPSGMTAYAIPISPETSVAYAPQKGDHVMVMGCMLLIDVDQTFQTRLPDNTTAVYPSIYNGDSVLGIVADPGEAGIKGRFELDAATNQLMYLIPSEPQRPRLVCQTVIQDATVLQVGLFSTQPVQAGAATTPTPTPEPNAAPVQTALPNSITLILTPQDTLVINYMLLSGAKLSLALRGAGDYNPVVTDPVTLQYVMDQKNIPSPMKLPYSIEPRKDDLMFPTFDQYYVP